jgi:hypothetical protein
MMWVEDSYAEWPSQHEPGGRLAEAAIPASLTKMTVELPFRLGVGLISFAALGSIYVVWRYEQPWKLLLPDLGGIIALWGGVAEWHSRMHEDGILLSIVGAGPILKGTIDRTNYKLRHGSKHRF